LLKTNSKFFQNFKNKTKFDKKAIQMNLVSHSISYPPSIRAVYTKIKSENFNQRKIFIVPYTGGFVGNSSQETNKFIINLNENQIDQFHAEIKYDFSEKSYLIIGKNFDSRYYDFKKKYIYLGI
jgi:hypothetical protein